MRRKVFVAGGILLALLVIGGGALWIRKPWVPPIVLTDPGPTGRRIVEGGVVANYFPAHGGPATGKRAPAVMVLGGSEGGIGSVRPALALQRAGFNVLMPAYFGAPGQPKHLELVPLETFDRALAWLRGRPEVDPKRIAVTGQSKGSEAALLVGIRHPELRAVVASASTSAVWPGINWDRFVAKSSWSSAGRPLPYVPYGGIPWPWDIGAAYRKAMKTLGDHPDGIIHVEQIHAPVLLVCGEMDSLWPACTMARQDAERSKREHGPSVRVLAYPDAGHKVFGPPVPRSSTDYGALDRWGGTSASVNAARADAWPKIVRFLQEHLR